jgi:hypothetical protein
MGGEHSCERYPSFDGILPSSESDWDDSDSDLSNLEVTLQTSSKDPAKDDCHDSSEDLFIRAAKHADTSSLPNRNTKASPPTAVPKSDFLPKKTHLIPSANGESVHDDSSGTVHVEVVEQPKNHNDSQIANKGYDGLQKNYSVFPVLQKVINQFDCALTFLHSK